MVTVKHGRNGLDVWYVERGIIQFGRHMAYSIGFYPGKHQPVLANGV